MEILNIGPLELILILLVMFFLLGPKGMIEAAQKIGQWIRKIVKSPVWKEIMGYSQDIRELPKMLMDETGLQEALDEVQQTTKATTAELNATVNEAVQAARVPEVEHVRINPGAGAASAAPTVDTPKPAGEGSNQQVSLPPSEGETQVIVSPTSEATGESSMAAPGAESSLVEASSTQSLAETIPGVEPESQGSPERAEKKPRRRVRATQEGVSAPASNKEKTPAPRRARARKADLAEVEAAATGGGTVLESAPSANTGMTPVEETKSPESSTPPVRKPRAKKLPPKDTTGPNPEQTMTEEASPAAQAADQQIAAPRKLRAKKSSARPAPAPGDGSEPEPAPSAIQAVENT